MPNYIKLQTINKTNSPVHLHIIRERSSSKVFVMKECNPSNCDNFKPYEELFQTEYTHMRDLEALLSNSKIQYSNFFPKYIQYGKLPSGAPCIIMEYIKGTTLEEKLSKGTKYKNPHFILTFEQIRHLIDQIYEAQCLLYKTDMLQLDLNPSNIIVQNENFDIKLIDFTDAYYISDDIRNKRKQPHKLMDNRISRTLTIERQLQASIADLFTRLFYRGNDCYRNFTVEASRHSALFEPYKNLLVCLEQRQYLLDNNNDKDKLYYWHLWYEQFCRLFN